jgi:hypothetical protein
MSFAQSAYLARPDGAGGFDGSPYLYGVQWSERGPVPTDLVRHVGDAGLAEVTSTLASATAAPSTVTSPSCAGSPLVEGDPAHRTALVGARSRAG